MRFISVILSLLILQSSFGMYFSKHYCGGQFRYVTFFSEANCCDQAEICLTENTVTQETELNTDGCCSNEHIYISSLKAEAKVGENLNGMSVLVPEQIFVDSSHSHIPQKFISTSMQTNRHDACKPVKLPILFQTFLL